MKKPSFRRREYSEVRNSLIRPRPMGLILAAITAVILCANLFGLVPFSPAEHPEQLGSASLSEIKKNIIFGPVKGIEFGILKYTENDTFIRLSAALGALVAALLLYFMLRKWYTARVSFLTSLMFITSSLFLHQGRAVNNEVMYLGVLPALLLSCMWFLSKRYDTRLPIAGVLVGLALYVPGTWIFLLAGLAYFRKYLWRASKKISLKIKLLSGFLLAGTLVPLAYSFIFAQRQIIEWLGWNSGQVLNPKEIGLNFLDIPRELFISGRQDALFWLPGTPVFDIFSIAMIGLGLYAYRAGKYPAREKLLLGSLVLAVLLIGVGNVATVVLLIPLLYLFIANGLAYMLQSWFTVFPRNPVARSLGIIILTIAVGFSCFYQLNRYFVAWPQADSTKAALERSK